MVYRIASASAQSSGRPLWHLSHRRVRPLVSRRTGEICHLARTTTRAGFRSTWRYGAVESPRSCHPRPGEHATTCCRTKGRRRCVGHSARCRGRPRSRPGRSPPGAPCRARSRHRPRPPGDSGPGAVLRVHPHHVDTAHHCDGAAVGVAVDRHVARADLIADRRRPDVRLPRSADPTAISAPVGLITPEQRWIRA